MGSLLRTAKKHKKSRRLGEPEVMAREEYGELEVDVKIEMIRSLIPLGLMHVHELLDDEVKELAGERYARKDELERGRRHGTNPGTVGLAGQRVPIRVPRVRSQEGVEIPLRSYEALNDGGEVNDLLLKRVLYGISCRNYEAAAEAIPGAIGLSSSTVSHFPKKGVVAPLWLRAKSAYGGGRGMFEHEVSQALPVQAREAEEVPRSQLGGIQRGLRRRGDLTVWFDEEAIANWKADKTGEPGGQRVYSDMAIETGLVVRMVYKLAYRQTEGFLHSIASLLGLGIEIPDYSTLCRRSRLLRKKLRIPKAASTQPIHLMNR